MSIKELQELIKLINRYKLAEFSMKDGDFEIFIRSDQDPIEGPIQQVVQMPSQAFVQAPAAAAAPAAAVAPAAAAPATPAAADESNLIAVKSPMVGTFYRSSSPDKPSFVKVGDTIGNGDVVCIIEAMKLFNEIESEVSGTIVKVLVEDAQPVEYDQVLFMVDPS
ncbi:MAG: acetyl-CoA carboxylase biotin carboxyl carrier protein [Saprospiraceae bacterium]